MDPRPPGDPQYTQVPTQGHSPNHMPMPPPPPYPNEPPPKYEPPKQTYHQPQDANYSNSPGCYQQPYYPTTSDSYQHGSTVMSQPVFVVHQMGFGPNPRNITCPFCHVYVQTATEYQTGALTWLVSGLLCLFGCWMGCYLLPFCIEDMQDVIHRCPSCNKTVGVCRRLE
ncbi:LITAF [Acanthosepion pharaonis]|uniref:LITAF n=1 Tax=Acanthosepion pharaonis TaxID=158019 RepID=A0A812DD28_ACAPH|nr:LITAF [Sepia pharaonis]